VLFVVTVEGLCFFFGRVEGLCSLSGEKRYCAVCWYSRGTVLFFGIVEGLCWLLFQ